MKITVIGCGRWGSCIAWYLTRIGHDVVLYGRKESKHMQQFLATRSNDLITLSEKTALSTDISCVCNSEAVVISVASQGLRALLSELNKLQLKNKYIILCMKGIEISTGKRLSEIATEMLDPSNSVAVWLGPGHVQEFYSLVPNCMVIDSEKENVKTYLINQFSSELIRFYIGRDLLGNEIGAASKNVIGIAAGMLDGLGLSTLKGALMSRGTREIARLISAMGGNELSAYGLCHLGDYEATVFSPYSHNRAYGERFVQNQPYTELAEGYFTVAAIKKLETQYKTELPICSAVYDILYNGSKPAQTLDELFSRSLKAEF